MSVEQQKLTQNQPGNSFPDGQTDAEAVESRVRGRKRPHGGLITLLSVVIAILIVLLLVLTGLSVYYGLSFQRCEKKTVKEELTQDFDSEESLGEEAGRDVPLPNVRLPRDVLPRFYNIRLQAHLDDEDDYRWFNGSVIIKIYCTSSTDSIFVHAHSSLNVSLAQLKIETLYDDNTPGTQLKIKNVSYNELLQWFHITLQSNLEAGRYYRVTFGEFRAELQIKELKGWYLSYYEENGVKKYLATSQMQPTDARRVFPCWDEPAFKARFQVTLVRRGHFHSLSNMPLQMTVDMGDGWYADVFPPTMNTSTYLLAFVVSQFASISGVDYKGRNFTVWARPNAIQTAQYALEVGLKIIRFFEEYFEVPYPLEKTDMIAVPHFGAGAMENWGLMIYREASMLWDPATGTASSRQKVATVVSHEIAHQWFGNLVTLTWWDDLWLNEGFASFAEVIGVDHVHPDWHMEAQTVVDSQQKVLIHDATPVSHPLVQTVHTPGEINNIFDIISYSKGAAILRMLESFLGRETFRLGLKKYLSEYKFKNTVEDDLWRSLEEVAKSRGLDLDIKGIMDTWLRQMNYPLITVEPIQPGVFQFTQYRYFEDMNMTKTKIESPYNFEWKVPLTYGTPKSQNWEENELIWLKTKSMVRKIDIDPNQWYVFNLKQAGFYRVNYPDSNWQRLTQQLMENHSVIPMTSRMQIIDDLFNLANRGNVSYKLFLELTKYLAKEDEFVPWDTAYRTFAFLLRMLTMDSSFGNLQAYVRTLVDKELRLVDWDTMIETENHLKHLLRTVLTKLACEVHHRLCIQKSKQMYAEWMANNQTNRIPPGLRETIYCTALQWGGELEWHFLHAQLEHANSDEDRNRIRKALPCTRVPWLLKQYILSVLSRPQIDAMDITEAITNIVQNPVGQFILWNHIREAWGQTISEMESDNKKAAKNIAVVKLIRIISKRMNMVNTIPTKQQIVGIENLASSAELREQFRAGSRDIFRQIELNSIWLRKHGAVVKLWLSENVPDNTVLL